MAADGEEDEERAPLEEDGDEERDLEEQLESQLLEQRDSLSALNEALASDPSNPEIISVQEELILAIKDAEEGLLYLKRTRLLREIDLVSPHTENLSSSTVGDVKAVPLGSSFVEAEPLEGHRYSVGSKCRFRYTDGRWYNGLVIGLEDGSDSARVCFLTPTSEKMLMCKFFRQQRCRFGSNCRLSHGIDIPMSCLKRFVPTAWEQSFVGSSILAVSENKSSIWREAELEYWNNELQVGQVVFRDDGSSAQLGANCMALSERAAMSDGEEEEQDEDSDSSAELSESSDPTEEDFQGLGFLEGTALQRGAQTETVIFAKWENHTRGVASKIMANMGYREGMGLGRSGQGMVNPIPVKVLPPKQSLDLAVKADELVEAKETGVKKRSRGGKRKREKKFAAAARALKNEEESRPDMFSLINSQLAMHNSALNGESVKKHQRKDSGGKTIDRRAIVAYDDELKELRMRVEKLEEMAARNKKEKMVYDAAMRKLAETRKALAEAEAAQASVSNAVVTKEKEKRWLKF
ncbi:hypothetical protein MLD38_014561 [Melastoma candidum]|uniref:Uncharacterized protein n=1 Tax=Melastoma candidum TaxID=119954 RepID=A0ACB9REI2_9MYRT|nr:hypothetical protein MLD38_014561 [Melastoma candidum]